MSNIPFADEIHAFLEDEENVEALTEAVQELGAICADGFLAGLASPRENLLCMMQEDHRQIHSQYNPNPFCHSRPDILDAHICAMRAVCQIGIDLGEGRDFTPTED